MSDASLGNAANVSVSVGDTNNVLCWRVLAAVLGAAVKMIKLIRPSSGRVAAWLTVLYCGPVNSKTGDNGALAVTRRHHGGN